VLVDPLDTAEIADGLLKLVEMSPDERRERLASLRVSLSRFTQAAFQRQWREALSCDRQCAS
jgi:trehalose-6-phosphate synthase